MKSELLRIFKLTPLRRRRYKRELKSLWKEWGVTWEEFLDFLGAMSVFVMIFGLQTILSLLGF